MVGWIFGGAPQRNPAIGFDLINFVIYHLLFQLQHGIDDKLISLYNHISEPIKHEQVMSQVLTLGGISPLS